LGGICEKRYEHKPGSMEQTGLDGTYHGMEWSDTNQKVANISRLRMVTTITRRGSAGVYGGQDEIGKL
jgi:hypothetical protein